MLKTLTLLVALLASAAGCAHVVAPDNVRSVEPLSAGPATIGRVIASSQEGNAQGNEPLQRQLRGWEEHARSRLERALTAKGYHLFDSGPANPEAPEWTLDIDVQYGNRALRWAVGFGAGKGRVRCTLVAVAGVDRNVRHRTTISTDVVMGLFGGDVGAALDEAVEAVLVGIPSVLGSGAAPKRGCVAAELPGWATATAREKRDLLRSCASPGGE